jgi:4-hydroxy-tetrahydrodipicolinate synthase
MIFEQGNPAGIKSVFKHLGLSTEEIRLPLVKADQDLDKRIANFVSNFSK